MKMPVVDLKILGKLTRDQKAEISRQFTETLQSVAGKRTSGSTMTPEA